MDGESFIRTRSMPSTAGRLTEHAIPQAPDRRDLHRARLSAMPWSSGWSGLWGVVMPAGGMFTGSDGGGWRGGGPDVASGGRPGSTGRMVKVVPPPERVAGGRVVGGAGRTERLTVGRGVRGAHQRPV